MMNYRFIPFLACALLFLPSAAFAATLSVVPSISSVSVGNIVTVRIITNTQGTAINEAGGTLQFPSDLLDVISVSKSGSIFSLWVEDPSYSNSAGTVSFDGGIPNPGYTGDGTVLTVTFHAKRAGAATLSFTDAAVRANDGLGTDVLSSPGTSQITIADSATVPTPPPAPTPTPTPTTGATTPPAAVESNAITNLVSSTHPDQNAWYANANPSLAWTVPSSALSILTGVSAHSDTAPSVSYKPPINQKLVTDLPDGVWYFNIRTRTATGNGPIASYKLQIDTTSPILSTPSFVYDTTNHQLLISNIQATDATSGISGYQLTIDTETPVSITPDALASGTYRYTYRTGGVHTAVFAAIDRAGNRATTTGTFVVPVALVDQTLVTVFGIDVTLLWFIISVLVLTIGALIAAAAAWYRLFVLRQSSRTKVAKREQVVHRALGLFKSDLERHIKSLEHASTSRELTEEEERLRVDLSENVLDLERYLKKEFKKFD